MDMSDREVVESLMDVSCFRTPYHKRRNVELRTKFDRNGRVTELTLGPKVLSTFWELPESIGELEQLKKLTLCHCSSLPVSLGSLENLESLELQDCKGEDMMLSPLFHRDDFSRSLIQRFRSLDSLEIKGGVWEEHSLTAIVQWITREDNLPNVELLRFYSLNSNLLNEIFDVLYEEATPRAKCTLRRLSWLDFSFSKMSDEDLKRLLFHVVPLYPSLETLSVPGNAIRSLQFLNDKSTPITTLSRSLRTLRLDHNPVLKYRDEPLQLTALVILLNHLLPFVGSLSTWENWDTPIEYLLRINRGGRILMESNASSTANNNNCQECSKLPVSMWPSVLEMAYRTSSKGYIPERKNATAVFYLLRNGPVLSEIVAGSHT